MSPDDNNKIVELFNNSNSQYLLWMTDRNGMKNFDFNGTYIAEFEMKYKSKDTEDDHLLFLYKRTDTIQENASVCESMFTHSICGTNYQECKDNSEEYNQLLRNLTEKNTIKRVGSTRCSELVFYERTDSEAGFNSITGGDISKGTNVDSHMPTLDMKRKYGFIADGNVAMDVNNKKKKDEAAKIHIDCLSQLICPQLFAQIQNLISANKNGLTERRLLVNNERTPHTHNNDNTVDQRNLMAQTTNGTSSKKMLVKGYYVLCYLYN